MVIGTIYLAFQEAEPTIDKAEMILSKYRL